MFHTNVRIYTDESAYNYLVCANIQHFMLNFPNDISDFMKLVVYIYGPQFVRHIETIAKNGRAKPFGIVVPHGITVQRLLKYQNPPSDLHLSYDSNSKTFSTGDETFSTIFTKLCSSYASFFEVDQNPDMHPFSDHFDDEDKDVSRQVEIFSYVLGFWAAVRRDRPDLMAPDVLKAIGFFAAHSGAFTNEGREFNNHISVTMDRLSRALSTMKSQAMLTGDTMFNPSRLIDGPNMNLLRDLSNSDFIAKGFAAGEVANKYSVEVLILASEQQQAETPRFSTGSSPVGLNRKTLSAHQKIEVISAQSDLLRTHPLCENI